MTTIAADPATGIIVCDSNIADGDQKWTVKKVEIINGAYYATGGGASDGEKFYEWVRKGRRGRKPKVDEDEFSALALSKKGLIYFDSTLYPMPMDQPFAIGSGGKAARALMIAGIDIQRAVEIACQVDAGSCLPLQIYRVEDLEEKKQ